VVHGAQAGRSAGPTSARRLRTRLGVLRVWLPGDPRPALSRGERWCRSDPGTAPVHAVVRSAGRSPISRYELCESNTTHGGELVSFTQSVISFPSKTPGDPQEALDSSIELGWHRSISSQSSWRSEAAERGCVCGQTPDHLAVTHTPNSKKRGFISPDPPRSISPTHQDARDARGATESNTRKKVSRK
jgi:hypothetical protein